jgi:hypothetical protein
MSQPSLFLIITQYSRVIVKKRNINSAFYGDRGQYPEAVESIIAYFYHLRTGYPQFFIQNERYVDMSNEFVKGLWG